MITFIKLLIITTNPHFGEDSFDSFGFGALRSADAENSIPGLDLTVIVIWIAQFSDTNSIADDFGVIKEQVRLVLISPIPIVTFTHFS